MNLHYFIAQMAPQFFDWTICRHTFLLLYSQAFRRNYSVMHLNLKYIHVFAQSWLRCFLFGGFVNLNDSCNYQNTFYLQGIGQLAWILLAVVMLSAVYLAEIFSAEKIAETNMCFFLFLPPINFPESWLRIWMTIYGNLASCC